PINTLLRVSPTPIPRGNATLASTLSISTLLYETCGINDAACATAFLPTANEIWFFVARAFALIPNFDQPLFQDPTQTIYVQHINNLNGWNKATAQFFIPGHDMAVTCMVRRARFHPSGALPSAAVVDTLAFCSEREYDAKWGCENGVDMDVNTYAIQISAGVTTYVGVTKRS
ncbi:hypothetical protein ACHHYP_00026, partial [Achlya hypogyna]